MYNANIHSYIFCLDRHIFLEESVNFCNFTASHLSKCLKSIHPRAFKQKTISPVKMT